ncbi:hypothetical protein acsn021_32050 [Anaerocolumna cellulosilytica]|uniref:Uncharacterized protein n=1 Tax=Anaerocolumna cellulosilytica TaxID=433286 RepID=A0A6S6R0Q8_9FIRM|nr:hypothetical protein [Anaerocolumna cellulosilytica]MBB5196535.1 hypothetical protein [Anaerocolumna cellulosilytica]BCJ95636.1 hypothetical protein acsn021_32050 [Anaerocolumna cellulosilytica]
MKKMGTSVGQCKVICSCIKEGRELNLEQLGHISECDDCMQLYLEFIERQNMIAAPHYVKDNILKEASKISAKQETRRRIEQQLNSKRMQLFRYSMKVGLAMCGALFLLFLPDILGSREQGSIQGRNGSTGKEDINWQQDISGINAIFDNFENGAGDRTGRFNLDRFYQDTNHKEEPLK